MCCCSLNTICPGCEELRSSPNCVLQCECIWSEDRLVTWRYYDKAVYDNSKMRGKELQEKIGNMVELKEAIMKQLPKYSHHLCEYTFLNNVRAHDKDTLDYGQMYIQTDYSAQPSMRSQNSLTCSAPATCSLSCWVIAFPVKKTRLVDGIVEEYKFMECTHLRAISPSRGEGKDQDWLMHHAILKHIIEDHRKEHDLTKVIIWTDGCPTQYKCRQNFYGLTLYDDILIIHRFAATSQFKGVHDKLGK